MTDQPVTVISPKTPAKTAAMFKAARRPNLINHQGEWFDWERRAYRPIEDATIMAEISEWLATCSVKLVRNGETTKRLIPCEPTPKIVADVRTMLKNECHRALDTMSPPCWLPGTPEELAKIEPRNIISLQNGLLDITTRKRHEPTPLFFTLTALDIDYDPNAPKPAVWKQFVREVFDGRLPLAKLLQESMGYLISSDTSKQKVFFLLGMPRSGKGTILRTITALVGVFNTTFPTVMTLSRPHGMQGLIGKSVAQVTDMDVQNYQNVGAAASNVNAVSGEDSVSIERKYLSTWDGKLPTRFILAGNTMPNFGSHTAAMATRLLVTPFDVSFLGREDRELGEKIKVELPGILNWALDGLKRLRERGDFEEPAESVEAKKRLALKSDPLHGFIEDQCVLNLEVATDQKVFYAAYLQYCRANGAHGVAMNKFTDKLGELFQIKRGRRGGVAQLGTYHGVRFNDATAANIYLLAEPYAPEMEEFGCTIWDYMKIDDTGFPVPRVTPVTSDFSVHEDAE